MKRKTNTAAKPKKEAPWSNLLRLYRKVRIPWALVLLSMLLSIALKEVESQLVPYVSQIQTGAIEQAGFLGGFVSMTILYGVVEAVQGGMNELGGAVMARNVRTTVWGKLIRLPMSFFDRGDPQQYVSRITQDTTGAYAAVTVAVQTISVVYGIYTNYVKMARVYHELALIMLSAIPITLLCAWICGKLEYQINQIVNNSYAAITNFFGERLPNLLHIKSCGMEDEEYRRGVEASEARYHAEIRKLNRFIFQAPIGTLGQYINEIVLLVVASALVRAGTMKMAQMVNLYNYFMLFMSNAYLLIGVWQGIKQSHGACETISEIVNQPDEALEGPHAPPAAADITFDHVCFAYDQSRDVLKDVSFVIPKGKVTAIVGENGSGKSTIIRLLERFNDPNTGKIYLGGQPLEEMDLRQWRDRVGYLFQGDQLVKGSIRENLCYGLDRDCTEEELIQAAKQAQAYDFICAREAGFDTELSRFDSRLSGGELQRLAIARILLKQPDYLIMDEATSGIDVVSEQAVLQGLTTAMDGKTVIMVSHDGNLIRRADHIIVLKDGRVEASGSYEQVCQSSALMRQFAQSAPVS
jgi:ATP-binding cassette subfamily B protein AbcA/BmrA